MRVILLTQDFPPRPGGMARYYADLARGWGATCTVLAGSWEGHPPSEEGAYRVRRLPFEAGASHRPLHVRRAIALAREVMREEPVGAVIAGNVRPFALPAARLARTHGAPLAVVYHGNDLLRTARRWRRRLLRRFAWDRLASSARWHVVNSRFTAGLARELGLPPERIVVVPPEVDTERFRPAAPAERAALRERRGWGEREVVSLFVGRLVARKGLDDALEALARVAPGARLVVAGPGDPAPWASRARSLGVRERVTFLGAVPEGELPLLYRAADLFVGPSRARPDHDDVEGFGIVFLEASASGLPVLATRCGGIPEAVEDGVGGVLVPPEDPAALAAAWNALAEDPARRRHLGDGGRSGRAHRHGPGSCARRFREALSECPPAS